MTTVAAGPSYRALLEFRKTWMCTHTLSEVRAAISAAGYLLGPTWPLPVGSVEVPSTTLYGDEIVTDFHFTGSGGAGDPIPSICSSFDPSVMIWPFLYGRCVDGMSYQITDCASELLCWTWQDGDNSEETGSFLGQDPVSVQGIDDNTTGEFYARFDGTGASSSIPRGDTNGALAPIAPGATIRIDWRARKASPPSRGPSPPSSGTTSSLSRWRPSAERRRGRHQSRRSNHLLSGRTLTG